MAAQRAWLRLLGALALLPGALASLRRHEHLSFAGELGGARAGPAAAEAGASAATGTASSGVRALAVGVRSAMAEAATISMDALGGTMVAAACVLISALVLLGIVGATAHEKERVFVSHEDSRQPLPRPAVGHYERRQRPGETFCLGGGTRDGRLPPSPATPTFPPPSSPPRPPDPPAPSAPAGLPQSAAQQWRATPTEGSESGSGEGRRQSSESSSQTSNGSLPLCPALVVRQPGGVSLAMLGTCAPYQQTEVVEFKRTDGGQEIVARAILAEEASGGGIVLESALRLPIAFLDTKSAVGRRNGAQPSAPSVAVSRASAAGARAEPAFGRAERDAAGEGCVLWRARGSPEEAVIVAVRTHGDGRVANVVDAEGRLLAATEARRPEPGARALRLLHVAAGVDSGLIMVAVLAAAKLQRAPAGAGC